MSANWTLILKDVIGAFDAGATVSGGPWSGTVVSWDSPTSSLVVSISAGIPATGQTVNETTPTVAMGTIVTVAFGKLRVNRAWYISINSGDWLIACTVDNSLYAVPLKAGDVISFGTFNISDVTMWNSGIALLIGPGGYFSWDGISLTLVNLCTGPTWTIVLTNVSGTFNPGDNVGDFSKLWGGVVVSWTAMTNTLVVNGVTFGAPEPGQVVINEDGAPSNQGTIVSAAASGGAGPCSGNWISVYAGRVWIAQNRTVLFSAPLSYTDWTVANGSGLFIILDTTLKGSITRLLAANGYLYIFGPTSIDIVSNVYVPAGATPPTPLFTRTNIDAVNGTPFSYSIILFGRLVFFYNVHGAHALSGVQVQRISSDIDQTMQQIDPNPPGTVSACVGVANNILTACFLLSWFDPTSADPSVSRQTLLSFHDGKWFIHDPYTDIGATAGTVSDIICVAVSCYIDGDPVGVIARYKLLQPSPNVFVDSVEFDRLFENEDAQLQRQIQTAFWPFGSSIHTKQVIRYGIEANVFVSPATWALASTVDTTGPASPVTLDTPSTAQLFLQTGPFTTINTGYIYFYGDVTQAGKYLGVTLKGLSGPGIVSAFSMEYMLGEATWAL